MRITHAIRAPPLTDATAQHPWLSKAMNRKDIGRVFQRVFMVKQLDKMGFGF